jgi:hypothetical protein
MGQVNRGNLIETCPRTVSLCCGCLPMLFIQPSSRRKKLRHFPCLGAPRLRVAHISTSIRHSSGARYFPPSSWRKLPLFRPQVLAGTLYDLQLIIARSERGGLSLESVNRAVIVLTECGQRPISDVSRVVLWQNLGVPVYELYVGSDGQVLAWECEAQEGWHIESSAHFSLEGGDVTCSAAGRHRVQTRLSGRLQTDDCPCGRAGTKLIDVSYREEESRVAEGVSAKVLAATA